MNSIRAITLLFLAAGLAVQPPATTPPSIAVELDVVVGDKQGAQISGLQKDDFEVKEDGHAVQPESLTEVNADATDANGYQRFIVLVLDDSSELALKDPRLTTNVKRAARTFAEKMGSANAVTILRSSSNVTAAPMSRSRALQSIDELTRSGESWQPPRFFQQSIELISAISRQMIRVAHRRKPVVLIGPADYFESENQGSVSRDWLGAATAAANANVATYVIDPTDLALTMLRPRRRVSGTVGFAGETGGYVFTGASADHAVDQIWSEAGHYYLLTYSAPASGATTHKIDVKVRRSGMVVRSRRTR